MCVYKCVSPGFEKYTSMGVGNDKHSTLGSKPNLKVLIMQKEVRKSQNIKDPMLWQIDIS